MQVLLCLIQSGLGKHNEQERSSLCSELVHALVILLEQSAVTHGYDLNA